MNQRNAGRKKILSKEDMANIKERHTKGETVSALAVDYHVSRQTMSLYINMDKRLDSAVRLLSYAEWIRSNKNFAKKADLNEYNLRLEYYDYEDLCTEILVDEERKRLLIKNHCINVIDRAFGVVDKPTWEDYKYFLEDRCIPKNRQMLNKYLDYHNIPGYDPISIIEDSEGRMAEDGQWIKMYRLRRQ